MPVSIQGLELRDGQVLRDGNLTVSVHGTEWDIGGTKGTYAGSTGNAVTDDDTNYVYLDNAGALQINTSGFPGINTAHARLATVIAVGGVITNVVDNRANIQGTIGGAATGAIIENGFVDASDTTMSFTDGTRTFQIGPTGANFVFWSGTNEYTKSAAEQLVIPNSEGLHIIYYDAAGALQSSQIFFPTIITETCIVAIVYWDATNSESILFHEERHGRRMDGETHLYLHGILGAQVFGVLGLGFGFSGITADGNGSLDAHAQCAIAGGSLRDEDISLDIVDGSPQTLSPAAQIPLFYRLGASGSWRRLTATNFPVTTTGTGRAAWNENTGATWQLTEVGDTEYVLTHLFATGDLRHPIIGLIGQSKYTTLSAARDGSAEEIGDLDNGGLAGLIPETAPIGTLIYQSASAYTNTVKSRIRSTQAGNDYIDWRIQRPGLSHENLKHITEDDHHDRQHGLGSTADHTSATLAELNILVSDANLVPDSRDLIAGAGLTGGGDLSDNRTFDVAANVDGSIVVNANDVQVGVLDSDAQHGTRGGGTQHAVATTSVAGFMSAADKTKLDDLNEDKNESHLFYADMLIDIDDADWSVNANATAVMDTNDAAIQVRLFDDTTEEGAGFILSIPTGVTELTFGIKSRAETAPGAAQTVASTLHYREIPDNGAVGFWSQYDLADVNIPTNENWQYDTQLITLATLSMTAGRLYQFEFTRNTGDAGDTLSGDWAVVELGVVYDVPTICDALFYGDQLDYPLNSDWNIDTPASGSSDSNDAALTIRRFDDTTEEGVGFLLAVPAGATQITVREKSRAETAPGASQNVARTLHYRRIQDDGAVGSWSTYDLALIAMPTNENWQYDSQILSTSVLGVSAGSLYQWELSRDTADVGDTLVGDWALIELQMEFS